VEIYIVWLAYKRYERKRRNMQLKAERSLSCNTRKQTANRNEETLKKKTLQLKYEKANRKP